MAYDSRETTLLYLKICLSRVFGNFSIDDTQHLFVPHCQIVCLKNLEVLKKKPCFDAAIKIRLTFLSHKVLASTISSQDHSRTLSLS